MRAKRGLSLGPWGCVCVCVDRKLAFSASEVKNGV